MKNTSLSFGTLTCLTALFAYACAADDDSSLEPSTSGGTPTTTVGTGGSGASQAGPTTSSGEGGMLFTTSSSGGETGQGGSCVDLEFGADFVKLPVDIIFAIDNSGSMSQEIDGVEQNINQNFANIIGSSGIDYRVIMVTDHGTDTGFSYNVCVDPPLSGTMDCNQPAVEVPNQFYHYDTLVYSNDAFAVLLDTLYGSNGGGRADEGTTDLTNSTYSNGAASAHAGSDPIHPAGWSQFLRPEAVKVFVVVTDDDSRSQWNAPGDWVGSSTCDPFNDPNCFYDNEDTDPSSMTSQAARAALNFRNKLVAQAPALFQLQAGENFLWYSIAAMDPNPGAPNTPFGEGYGPNEPLVTSDSNCTGAAGLGTAYQWLSIGTDALRFPVCALSSYDAVFQAIAAGVEEGTSIPCEFLIPDTEDPIAEESWQVEYVKGDGSGTEQFDLVASAGACQGADEFYIEDDTIKLCPLACNVVSGDVNADINIIARCEGIVE